MPVPWDQSQVFYVWFDALLNYCTALKYARGEDLTERFWPPDFHLIGKDILKFHAVFWPAMLMAGEVELPRHLFIHGYLLMQGEKMSKTLGNVLDPFQVIDMYGVDALRYYCFREVSFGQDGSISTEGFEARYNTELANEYGNLASRTLAMIDRYRDGVVPEARAAGRRWRATSTAWPTTVCERLDRAELTLALEEIWKRVRRLNQFVEEQAPWNLAKDDGAAGAPGRDALRPGRGAARRERAPPPVHPATRRGRLLEALGAAGERRAAARRRALRRPPGRREVERISHRSSRRSRRSRPPRRERDAQLTAAPARDVGGPSRRSGAPPTC